jgi:hypothetical protein
VARRGLPRPVDADMAGLDQRSGTAAGLDHPRMPQPFVETLALQVDTPRTRTLFTLPWRGRVRGAARA